MGITPISNLTPLPLSRAMQADLDPLPMERVANSARTADETYSPSDGRSASGSAGGYDGDDSEDDYQDGDLFELGFDDGAGVAAVVSSGELNHPQQISFFA